MRNTIILSILLFVAVIGASIYYFTDLNGSEKEGLRPLSFLPKETFLVSSFHNDAITDNIFKDFEIFEALVGKGEMKQWQFWKSKLLRNAALQPYVNGTDILISFHPSGEKIVSLFSIPTNERIQGADLETMIREAASDYEVTARDTLGVRIFDLHADSKDSIFHITYYKHIIFASYSDSLIYKVTDPKQPKLSKAAIDYFVENNSRNSPLCVYFVHDQIDHIARHLMRGQPGSYLELFRSVGGQSAWNLNFKNDALILSGESETMRERKNYLEVFGRQSKTTQSLFNYFPENTASYMAFAISSSAMFHDDLQKMFDARGEADRLSNLFQQSAIDSELLTSKDTRQIFGNEFAIVEQSNQTILGFIKLNNSTEFSRQIDLISTQTGDSLFRFDHANMLYALFGDPFKAFNRPYFIRIGNIVVLASSQSVLQDFKRDWARENLLINTLGFKNFERIQGNEANVTYFQRMRSSSSLISNLLKPAFRSDFRHNSDYGFQDFYSWSVQISGNNGDFLSSIYGIYKSKTALGATPEWTYAFKNRPITAPQVFEHSDTSQFILIQEQDHTVHGIHPSGKQLWSAVFQGRVVGQAQQLADRSIVLVTDRNRLYRFDSNGNGLPGFSLGLSSEPSYSPTIADVGGEQLIFIPAGNELLVYGLDGRRMEKWTSEKLAGRILFDVKVRNNEVFVGTDNGYFYQFDAMGQLLRKEVVEGSHFRSPIAFLSTSDQSLSLAAVDTASNLVTVDFKNPAIKRKIGPWHGKSVFAFDQSGSYPAGRLIVLDGKKLVVNQFPDGQLIYDFTFTQVVDDRPQFFDNAGNGKLMGIASRENGLIYIFDEKGSVIEGFPIESMPLYYYGKIDYNSPTFLLSVRRDRKLYAFKK
ncbi:PQQ-like beta-propeller repeat protein [Sphingobacterium griseoflavum]|uniref:Uncharacterized protein n=1 Tax=Sphingobacterium griseoflavum TaxID=1474952 RepID=A0ABQ3HRR1_9SPHI|nr:PQQ-like beta-propeller repeat protein [Sphingobacterium griseoflavum]GHE23524.1 hypothetical protein GCM10017764_04920 [Sphingobacterium griseoflavum]